MNKLTLTLPQWRILDNLDYTEILDWTLVPGEILRQKGDKKELSPLLLNILESYN